MKYTTAVTFFLSVILLSSCEPDTSLPAHFTSSPSSGQGNGSGQNTTKNTTGSLSSPKPAPSSSLPPSPTSSELDAEESAFLELINTYRAQNGAPALTVSATLTQSAKWMSQDMATKDYLDHTDSLGRSFSTRIESFGYTSYSTIGENIAYGHELAQDTFDQWKNSPAHNQNMLNPSYREIGIGRFNANGQAWGWYWTTDFGG